MYMFALKRTRRKYLTSISEAPTMYQALCQLTLPELKLQIVFISSFCLSAFSVFLH